MLLGEAHLEAGEKDLPDHAAYGKDVHRGGKPAVQKWSYLVVSIRRPCSTQTTGVQWFVFSHRPGPGLHSAIPASAAASLRGRLSGCGSGSGSMRTGGALPKAGGAPGTVNPLWMRGGSITASASATRAGSCVNTAQSEVKSSPVRAFRLLYSRHTASAGAGAGAEQPRVTAHLNGA